MTTLQTLGEAAGSAVTAGSILVLIWLFQIAIGVA